MSLIFISSATLLIAGVALALARVLWRGPKTDNTIEHHAVNVAVLRDQLAELERDLANGTLSSSDHADAKQELQRRVLHEAEPAMTATQKSNDSKFAAITLIIALPLVTTLSYLMLGNPLAIHPPPAQNAPAMTQADVQAMVDSLEARLASNPDDPAGWLMLARSYRYFGNHEDAAVAFNNAAPIVQSNALALSQYAETLAIISEMGFDGEAGRLLERALFLDPNEPFALTLAGTAAFERSNYQAAIEYWQQLLEQLPPGTRAAQAVASGIERAQQESASVMVQ